MQIRKQWLNPKFYDRLHVSKEFIGLYCALNYKHCNLFSNAKYEMRFLIIIAAESRYFLKYKDYGLYYQTPKNVCIKVSEYFTSNKMSDSMCL